MEYKGTPLYLRDLKDSLQDDIKRALLKKRPDLEAHLDSEGDIAVGEYYRYEDYHSA